MEFITKRNINLAFYSSLFLKSLDKITKKEAVIPFTDMGMVSDFCQAPRKNQVKNHSPSEVPCVPSMEQVSSVLETAPPSRAHSGQVLSTVH